MRSPAIVVTGADYDVTGETVTPILTLAAATASVLPGASDVSNRLQIKNVQSCNDRRRRFEDNLAAVFMGFIFVFLICHMPRLLLNIHELIVMKGAMECEKHEKEPFSMWSLIMINVSHFLLVLNSGTNILIYCWMSTKFRNECSKIIQKGTQCKSQENVSSNYFLKARRANSAPPISSANLPKYGHKYLAVPCKSVPFPLNQPNSQV